jgi:hypothetical protein
MNAARSSNVAGINVKLPQPLKRALAEAAQTSSVSMNDAVVALIADHYNFPHAPSGRCGKPVAPDKLEVVIRLPRQLKTELQYDALRRRSNLSDSIVRIVSAALRVDVAVAPPRRQTPFGGGRRH